MKGDVCGWEEREDEMGKEVRWKHCFVLKVVCVSMKAIEVRCEVKSSRRICLRLGFGGKSGWIFCKGNHQHCHSRFEYRISGRGTVQRRINSDLPSESKTHSKAVMRRI